MKKSVFNVFFMTFLMAGTSSCSDLTKMEAFTIPATSTELTLRFSGPCDYTISENKSLLRCSILFKGTGNQASSYISDIEHKLYASKLIKNIKINELPALSEVPAGIKVDLYFAHKNVYVQFIPTENKNKFIIKAFSINALKKLEQKEDGPLLLTANIPNSEIGRFLEPKKKSLQLRKTRPRIMLDSGHGGESTGARGMHNLVEKDLVLDITRKAKKLLEMSGCDVFLTRSGDYDVSLLHRCELAQQCGVDAFISIHANSSGGSPTPQGLETFYFDSIPLQTITPDGYDCTMNEAYSAASFRMVVNALLKNRDTHSYDLAASIQNNLLSILEGENLKPLNRGIKKAAFQVLSRGEMPSALVEVGFITNDEEARRLAQQTYRMTIAKGIARGISNFIQMKGIL